MHTRIQLDPTAQIQLRDGADGVEIVITDPTSEASTVIDMTPQQLASLAEQASER